MNNEKPAIESLMKTTLENVKQMIDVNTIVGNPVETNNGYVVIPISKVSFGFASGGGEYNNLKEINENYPFAGGSGAAVTLQPVAFMVVGENDTKILSVEQNANMVDNILNMTPKILENVQSMFTKSNKTGKDNINTHCNLDIDKKENNDYKN